MPKTKRINFTYAIYNNNNILTKICYDITIVFLFPDKINQIYTYTRITLLL